MIKSVGELTLPNRSLSQQESLLGMVRCASHVRGHRCCNTIKKKEYQSNGCEYSPRVVLPRVTIESGRAVTLGGAPILF